jgi:hypothetical protein
MPCVGVSERNIMTGRGLLGWRFKNKTPLWFKVIVTLLMADAVAHFGLLTTVSSWALSSPDTLHSYRVPFRDGNIYFVQWWLGKYLDAWWIGPVLLAILVLLLLRNRDQLERVF